MGGPQKVWTAVDEDTLREMMASGAKRPAIAAALGRTQNSVTARVIKLGIQKPSRVRPVWTEADFATLEAMLAAGDSMPAIARVLKRNQTDVAAKAFASRQRKPTLLGWHRIGGQMVGSLIEHAARALCAHEGLPENATHEGRPMWMSFIPEARAVVAAMRKPTAEMLAAGRTEIVKVDQEGYC